ncbi:amino acid/amide ABC transporter substrate-binding protein, HAAT family [Paracoccus thiocyanatus]|uniref:Amino acid/amide ABC transporter substrate-binding protein, HAAT family n=2 Tax=Paracoccus thiocyanatus TaxID=34006 RepID=A0A1N6U7W3_9RHOB|nr:amino acid/amide ABC transporter substrate-binding protein, HAAT family [Paracoccus thiocyanatus]
MTKIAGPGTTRRNFMRMAAIAAGGLSAPSLIASRGLAAEPERIRMGMVTPLEGECAQWGIPITRAGQIWADEHNAQGGILCGDGERHMIDYMAYTNGCFFPNEEMSAFRNAILQDGCKYMFQTYTPASRKAIARLATQNGVLTNSYGGGFMSADFPYLMGGITGSPTAFLGLVSHVLERHPEIKRVALMFTDNSFGLAGRAYTDAGCAPFVAQGKVEIVYNELFDPNTTDYFPLLGAVMKTRPDAIFYSDLPPGKQAILLETAQSLKFDGVWMSHSWDLPQIAQRVDLAALDGRVYGGFGVDAMEPTFSAKAHGMYKSYVEKHGAGEWIGFAGLTYSAMATLDAAFAQSPSASPQDVMETLYGMGQIDHPIYGKSAWSGADIFGVNHHLLTPTPKYVIQDGGLALSGVVDDHDWWNQHKDAALPVLKNYQMTEV